MTFLRLQGLPRIVLYHDRRWGLAFGNDVAACIRIVGRIGAKSGPQNAAEVAAEHRRCGNRRAPAVQPPVVPLKPLKGAKEESLVLMDRPAQAEAVVPA